MQAVKANLVKTVNAQACLILAASQLNKYRNLMCWLIYSVNHLFFGGHFYLALLVVKTTIAKLSDCEIQF